MKVTAATERLYEVVIPAVANEIKQLSNLDAARYVDLVCYPIY